jgi:hypothetical protein
MALFSLAAREPVTDALALTFAASAAAEPTWLTPIG